MNMYAVQKTAPSWDSYKDPLLTVLNSFNPVNILEYGPGESTKQFLAHSSVKFIYTIEHKDAWAEKIRPFLTEKAFLLTETNQERYPYAGPVKLYDLIFIDGVERPLCIMLAKFRISELGIVVVHDAERMDYKKAISTWKYKFFADSGHTVFLTNSHLAADILERVL